ncbi:MULTISPECIES: SGNH/GDSL hydrolase family protein [Sphingobacterium]|uniref:SGNH/GDSL hydrolase family protein n=1 Tax=Sphingobacterium TaxID=28453 RepID=UPI002580B868|nr:MULTISPECIES: SGNH/GDSL hydrolase family protein [Sphingobacterium]
MHYIKPLLSSISSLLLFYSLQAQENIKYIPASELQIIGKAKKSSPIYERIPNDEKIDLPSAVQKLAKNSAGIAFLFETDSRFIAAKWQLESARYAANMTPIGHSGLDLYCLKDGKWQFVNVGKPLKDSTNNDHILINNMDNSLKQFMLYLPLYNTTTSIAVGVSTHAHIAIPRSPKIDPNKRIVIYGSSIVQGASASRPGMAYPAILQRELGVDVINLGFSGSAKMEKEVGEYVASVPADCYVLDCIPNPSPQEIEERIIPFIKQVRIKNPSTPIILVETVSRENGNFDLVLGKRVKQQNDNAKKGYDKLVKDGVKKIYYISSDELIGTDHEATTYGVHLSDLGFKRIANTIQKAILKALK